MPFDYQYRVLEPRTPPIDSIWAVHCDGATYRDNPSGSGSAAITVWCDDALFFAQAEFLVGRVTNNSAEFSALVLATKWIAAHLRVALPIVYTDSSLVTQFCSPRGADISTPHLQPLLEEVLEKRKRYPFIVNHCSRTDDKQQVTDYVAKLCCYSGRDLMFSADESLKQLIKSFQP